jgi:hypothetical protein
MSHMEHAPFSWEYLPQWLPDAVAEEAKVQARGNSPRIPAIITALIEDPRMKYVWRELRKHKPLLAHEKLMEVWEIPFDLTAWRLRVPEREMRDGLTDGDIALQLIFATAVRMALWAVYDAPGTVAEHEWWLKLLRQRADDLHDLRLLSWPIWLGPPPKLNDEIRYLEERLEEVANEKAAAPHVSQLLKYNSSRRAEIGYCRQLTNSIHTMYGKNLRGVVRTIVNVALALDGKRAVTRDNVRDWTSERAAGPQTSDATNRTSAPARRYPDGG